MKNTRRQTILVVMGILLVSLAFFGCGQKEEPDISIKTFSVGILHEDEDALKRFGADKESSLSISALRAASLPMTRHAPLVKPFLRQFPAQTSRQRPFRKKGIRQRLRSPSMSSTLRR